MRDEQYMSVGALGLPHFCIRHHNPAELLRQSAYVQTMSDRQTASLIDFTAVHTDDTSRDFMLLTDLNGWSYLAWGYWDFDTNVQVARAISQTTQTLANYYFVDSQIATSRWIFADNGTVTRAHFESHGEILSDSGFNAVERHLRETIKDSFVENLFYALYERTCISIELLGTYKRTELSFYTGTIGSISSLLTLLVHHVFTV